MGYIDVKTESLDVDEDGFISMNGKKYCLTEVSEKQIEEYKKTENITIKEASNSKYRVKSELIVSMFQGVRDTVTYKLQERVRFIFWFYWSTISKNNSLSEITSLKEKLEANGMDSH